MLKSMGSQRVRHDLVTEKQKFFHIIFEFFIQTLSQELTDWWLLVSETATQRYTLLWVSCLTSS